MNLDDRLAAAREQHRSRSWPVPAAGTVDSGAGAGGRPVQGPARRRVLVAVLVAAATIVAVVLAARAPRDGDTVVGPVATGTTAPSPGDGTAGSGSATTSGSSSTRTPVRLDGLVVDEPEPAVPAAPAGWQLMDWAEFRFAVPEGWIVPASRSCWQPNAGGPTATGAVLLRSSPADDGPSCSPEQALPDSVLTIEGEHAEAVSGEAAMVGDWPAQRLRLPTCSTCATDVFQLGSYRLTIKGSEADAVLATFTRSGRDRALRSGPMSDTTGWRPLVLDGVSVLVPPAWAVVDLTETSEEQSVPGGGIQFSGRSNRGSCSGSLFEPPAGETVRAVRGVTMPVVPCPQSMVRVLTPADGVWLRPKDATTDLGDRATERSVVVEGTTISLLAPATSVTVPVIDLAIERGGTTTLLSIGVGADAATARAILHSLTLAAR